MACAGRRVKVDPPHFWGKGTAPFFKAWWRGGRVGGGKDGRPSTARSGGPPPLKEGRIRKSGGLLLPGAPRTAGVRFCCPARPGRAFGQCNLVREDRVTLRLRMPRCRWHLGFLKHLTAYSCRAKTSSLNTRRSWFGPIDPATTGGSGGAAGYCPRVRCVYFTTSLIAIASVALGTVDIGASAPSAKCSARMAR